jgi:ABC-type nickel/cobalt efflux system permease component RcnA
VISAGPSEIPNTVMGPHLIPANNPTSTKAHQELFSYHKEALPNLKSYELALTVAKKTHRTAKTRALKNILLNNTEPKSTQHKITSGPAMKNKIVRRASHTHTHTHTHAHTHTHTHTHIHSHTENSTLKLVIYTD